jgi:ornithine cyclodeaminase/alanine dehydrogenase-like protein (mu-crystallin family)
MEGVPFLTGDDVRRLLTPREALWAVQRFFRDNPRERVAVPARIHLNVPGQNNIGLYMPAATDRYVGVKLAHLMPQRRPNVEAEVFLYAAESGRLLFWGDGKPLTALRTAGISAAGALAVLPACEVLAVFGTGLQAAAHIMAFADAYPMLHRVEVVARSGGAWEGLLAQLPPTLRQHARRAPDARSALAEAQAVVTTTPAPQPIFAERDLPPRCHIAAIGSAAPGMNELPPALFPTAQVWLDSPAALKESGDCIAALRAGWPAEQVAGDQFDLIGGPAPTGAARTLFKTVGHAAQDLALLIRLWELVEGGGR